MATFIRKHLVARKPHRCELCTRSIRQGERYMRGVGIDEGTAWTWRECAHCEWLMGTGEVEWDDGYGDETILEWEPRTWTLVRAKANWRRKWTARDGSLVEVPS